MTYTTQATESLEYARFGATLAVMNGRDPILVQTYGYAASWLCSVPLLVLVYL